MLATYSGHVVDAPDDVLDLARAADLYALVDLAARRAENPVAERAHHLLAAIAASGDLHACPSESRLPISAHDGIFQLAPGNLSP